MKLLLPALLAGGLLVLRPVLNGVPLLGTLAFWAFVLVTVIGPGVLVWRAWGSAHDRGPLLLVQGATAGVALHGLASFAALSLGRSWMGEAALLALGLLAFAWQRRAQPSPTPQEPPPGAAPLLWLLVGVFTIQPLFSTSGFWEAVPIDLLFHAGNAAEVRQRWPLEDPRVAGLPLDYHVLSYALPAAASRFTGLPAADTLLALVPLLWISLFVLQVYHAGLALFGERAVGLLGAVLLVLNADPGPLLRLPAGAFNSFLSTGIYSSPTTILGFVFFLAIVVWVHSLLAAERLPRAPAWVLAGLLGVAASATKPSVNATLVGGLLLVAVWARIRRHPAFGRALLAAVLLAAATLPPALASSAPTRASDFFQWAPGAVIWESVFARHAFSLYGSGVLVAAAVVVVWAVGYFGAAGVGFLAYLRLRSAAWGMGQTWALAVFLTGAGLAFTFAAPGLSQLFFLYNGQLLLALFGAAGLLAAFRRWRFSPALLLSFALLAAPSAGLPFGLFRGAMGAELRPSRPRPPDLASDYARGLAWLRAHATQGVVFADNRTLVLSAFGECRTFYEGGHFTQRGFQERRRGNPEPFPDRVELQQRFLFAPGPAVVQEVRSRLAPGTVVRVVADAVQPQLAGGRMVVAIGGVASQRHLPPELFDLEYSSRTMHVYRLRP